MIFMLLTLKQMCGFALIQDTKCLFIITYRVSNMDLAHFMKKLILILMSGNLFLHYYDEKMVNKAFQNLPNPYWTSCIVDRDQMGSLTKDDGTMYPEPRSVPSFTRIKCRKNSFFMYGGIGMLNAPLSDAWILTINEDLSIQWNPYHLSYDHGKCFWNIFETKKIDNKYNIYLYSILGPNFTAVG